MTSQKLAHCNFKILEVLVTPSPVLLPSSIYQDVQERVCLLPFESQMKFIIHGAFFQLEDNKHQ